MPLFRKFVGIFKAAGVAIRKRLLGGLPAVYVEDVFSNYLYSGDNSNPVVINNGIDISGKGGLIWLKARSGTFGADRHELTSTNLSAGNYLSTNNNYATSSGGALTTISSNGFTLSAAARLSFGGGTYVSWTFRKQAKFFDVVTYTGTQNYGGSGQTVSHNLGSTPGCIIIKPLSDTSGSGFTLNDWIVYHRGLSSPTSQHLKLNTTASIDGNNDKVKAVSSTTFTAGWEVGLNGIQYVAYIFAHDAGGFGLTGTDNVVSCGRLTASGAATTVNLGYEPQWLLVKELSSGYNWAVYNTMEGMSVTEAKFLKPNATDAEATDNTYFPYPTATGFGVTGSYSNDMIYIAIRRGPMKVPTSGTSVFSPVAYTGNGTTNALTGIGFPPDLMITKGRPAGSANEGVTRDRLRGTNPALRTTTTNAESSTTTNGLLSYDMDGVTLGVDNTGTDVNGQTNTSGNTYVNWLFKRAPSFFDEVCYTGTGSATTQTHNLGVAPELMIVKRRSAVGNWVVYSAALGNATQLILDSANASSASAAWNSTTPTSTVFSIGTASTVNSSGVTYVAYLFATCAGVSKVGQYSGTGSAQTINCGFTSGARFVLIKRDNAASTNWYVWDSARGITASNDPFLWLNTTAVENTSTNYIDTDSTGFKLTASAPSQLNAAGGTYIFLAIA